MCTTPVGAAPPVVPGAATAGAGGVGAANQTAPANGGPPPPMGPHGGHGGIPADDATKGVGQLGGATDALLSTLRALADTLAKLAETLSAQVSGGGPGGGCGDMPPPPGAPPTPGVMGLAGAEVAAPVAMQNPVVGANVAVGANGREDHAFEQEVLDRVNAIRQQNGLKPVSFNAQLDTAAERHNLVQIQTQSMAHVGIGDGDPGSRIRATGFRGQWGENVAVGQRSAEQVVREWMNSPTHRANILNPQFGQMGVSYGTTNEGFAFWTQSFGA